MLLQALTSLQRVALLITLAVALVATGFAHGMPGPRDAAQAEALAFALANGAGAADLCGEGLPGDAATGQGCMACQITGTAHLAPQQATPIKAELAFVARIIAPRESRAQSRVLDPAHSPQGPPVA